jgi:hypothetical protein
MSDHDQVVAHVKSSFEAWSAHDVERILEESGGAGGGLGFGFRTRDARVGRTVVEQRQGLTAWFGSLDRYRIDDIDVNCSVDDDLATVWGFFTEDFAHTGQEPERVRVRYSVVYRRAGNQWQPVWNHRDIQEFAEDGFYIRKPLQDA